MWSVCCKEIGFESSHVPDHLLLKCSIQLMGYENKNQSNMPDASSIKFDCGVIPPGFFEHERFLPLLNEKKIMKLHYQKKK